MQTRSGSESFLRILSEDGEKVCNRAIACAEHGDGESLAELIERGHSVCDCRGLFGFSCLHHACNRGHIKIVAALLKHGSEVNARNDSGETSLHLACYAGQLLIVDMLLDYGACVNAQNRYLETPLFYAVKRGMPAVTRLLLQRGADREMVDQFGDRVIDLAPDERTRSELSYEPTPQCSDHLSYDVLLHVFAYLTPRELCRCACVCGRWHRAAENEDTWGRFGLRRWQLALYSSLGFENAPSASFTRRFSNELIRK